MARFNPALVLFLIIILTPCARAVVDDDPFAARVRPLLDRYCVSCHGETKPKAGVRLHTAADKSAVAADRRLWQSVIENVEAGIMPPDGKPVPSDTEREALVRDLNALLASRDCTIEQPGRVTLRRLNRAEYLNTVRDLLGVGVDRPELLPLDDVGYGFDTIGDVLSMPPLLLEKYLTVAEGLSERALPAPRIDNGQIAAWHPSEFDNAPPDGRLASNIEIHHRLTFPDRGVYRLQISAHGEQAGSEPPKLLAKLDGQPLRTFDVTAADPDSPADYSAEIPVKQAGERTLTLAFTNDFYQADHPDPAKRDRNLVLHQIALLGKPQPPLWPLRAWQSTDLEGGNLTDNGRSLASSGELTLTFDAPADGLYRLEVRASGDQAGTEPVRMGLRVNGKDIRAVDVPARDSDPGIYPIPAPLRKGKNQLALVFLNDYYQPDSPDPKLKGDRNLHVHSVELLGDSPAGSKDKPSLAARPPRAATSDAWRDAARPVLAPLMERAYRRSVRPEEVERLLSLVELARHDGEPFERGLQLAVQAILVSPHFLFRVELDRQRAKDGKDPAPIRPLTGYELASRLSYFLWSTMPDDQLLKLARENQLQDDRVLEAQVLRMLKDPRSRALVDNFAGQWLQLRKLESVTPDPSRFATFNEDLRRAMRRETELFFESVIRDDRPVLDFLDADYAFLNERLAKHYGIDGVTGDEFRKVTLPASSPRGGLLTQASILTLTSNPGRTSPVKRGKYILEQILGTPPPPPPADVPPLEDDKAKGPLKGTLRQRFEQHRSNPSCAGCHAKLDPLGFGFENFDAIGAWRTNDGDTPVDPSGTLPGSGSFQGVEQLKTLLRDQKAEQFTRCLTEKLMIYGLGRGLDPADACAVDAIVEKTQGDNSRFSRLILEITKSDPFRKRSREELSLQ